MKTYIGTKDGERVFIEWELKDSPQGKQFSASGYYMNAAGTDHSVSGQCIDEIVKDFPDDNQALEIRDVHDRFHLNNITAGSPKQMECIDKVIKPNIRDAQELWDEQQVFADTVVKRLTKILMTVPIELVRDNTHEYCVRIFNMIAEREPEVSIGILFHKEVLYKMRIAKWERGGVTICVDSDLVIDIKKVNSQSDKRPTLDHETICKHLQRLGRLHDPHHMVDGGAYRYASKLLLTSIPDDIITLIEAWVEVPEPDELSLVAQFVEDHQVSCSPDGRGNHNCYKWIIRIGGETYSYQSGSACPMDHEWICKNSISCLMGDAHIGRKEDPIEYLINDLWYEYNDAKGMARGCIEIAAKLGELYDERLAL